MILDNGFNFTAGQQAISTNADVLGTNVFDLGVSRKLFAGSAARALKVPVVVSAMTGTTPTFRARLVGADDNALSVNPIILSDTGVSRAIVAASDLPLVNELVPSEQLDAKRFYGIIFTMGGTTPTATVSANLAMDSQSNLLK